LKAAAGISPTVQQEQGRIVCTAPFVDGVVHASDTVTGRPTRNFGLIAVTRSQFFFLDNCVKVSLANVLVVVYKIAAILIQDL
jgi:hypothetical protein